MFSESTSVESDVIARSVVAEAIDAVTGEVFQARLTPVPEDVIGWVQPWPWAMRGLPNWPTGSRPAPGVDLRWAPVRGDGDEVVRPTIACEPPTPTASVSTPVAATLSA